MYRKNILSIVLVLFMVSVCMPSQMNNNDLRDRISKMEKELESLKTAASSEDMKITSSSKVEEKEPVKSGSPWNLSLKSSETKSTPAVTSVKPVSAQTKPDTSKLQLGKESSVAAEKSPAAAEKKPVAAAPAPKGLPLWSNLDIQFYGYVKFDASYDTSLTTAGNYAVYVDSEATNPDDDGFNMTANQTRLGFKINGPEKDGIKSSGLLEFDFYGNYASENKAKIQMRHAYLKLNWANGSEILAGQTSDVMSPLCPSTLNYTVLWDVGNIGYRRPQIRYTKTWTGEDKNFVKFEAALARSIGTDKGTSAAPYAETGMDAGYPTAQSRLSMSFPLLGYKPTTLGFSGHIGREEYDTQNDGSNKKFESWSANIDLTQPINKWLTIQGEYFRGETLGTYFGGIGQSVNTASLNEIGAQGGWIAASVGPWDKWNFNIGAGVDDVERDDVASGSKIQNATVFGNFVYAINSNTQIGFELSQWETAYKNLDDSDSTRAQLSLTYKF
ncbi:MAG: hypothetical protein JW787_01425 [Sedimentisphaerales bacterium]|nr:hypothetical protein [Sedimentisphaerales bacterium]